MEQHRHFRSIARRQVELRAVVTVHPDRTEHEARIVDLGLGGACFEVTGAVGADTRIVLEIRTPTRWDPLVLDGAVAWARLDPATGVTRGGVFFSNNDPHTLLGLFELLEACAFGV